MQLRVTGESMAPTLRAGWVVEVSAAAAEEVRPGEVVVLEPAPGEFLVHRLVRVLADGRLLTQGDGCAQPDPAWPRTALRGRLVRSIDGAGRAGTPRPILARFFNLTMRHGHPSLGLRVRRVLGRFAWCRPVSAFAREINGAGLHAASATEVTDRYDVQHLGEEWVVFDRETNSLHHLNPTAGIIWKCLQEGLNVTEIAEKLRGRFPEETPESLENDVEATIDELEKLHLSAAASSHQSPNET